MRRRDFIKAVAGSAASWPLAARAQPKRMRRIGVLLFARPDRAIISPLIQQLETLGYIDGKTAAIEYRDGNGMPEYIVQAADELVRLSPEVIFAFGGDIAPIIKRATTTIPIVVVVSNDPVASGLVPSLARPGGNITGLTQVHDTLAGKSVELLKDTVPAVSALPFCGIRSMPIRSSGRRSALRAHWACNCGRSRCVGRRILPAPSRLPSVSAPRR